MARQIIKQPNGLYCVYSSITDQLVASNSTREEIIEMEVAEARERLQAEVDRILNQLENGGKPYYQFTMTFEEILESIEHLHGKVESDRVKSRGSSPKP